MLGVLSLAGVTAYRVYRKDIPERYPEWDYGDRHDTTEPDVAWLEEFCKQNGYKILLCHHPEYRDSYLKDCLLILCCQDTLTVGRSDYSDMGCLLRGKAFCQSTQAEFTAI